MKKAKLLAVCLAVVCMASVPLSVSAKTHDTNETLALYEEYNKCIENYIDIGNGLFMENYMNIGESYAVVVTDGTADGATLAEDVLASGFTGCNNWEALASGWKMIETDFTADDPANTSLLSITEDTDLAALARDFALKNDYVKEIYLCEFAEYVPCSWSKSFTLVVPAEIQELDAADFPQLEGMDCKLQTPVRNPEAADGVRLWTCSVSNADEIQAQFDNTENSEQALFEYLKGVADAIAADESNPALTAVVNYGFPVSSGYGMETGKLNSVWEGFGDFDSDGAVDSSDAAEMLIRAAALGAADALHTNADLLGDLNNDGELNAADAAAVLTYAAEIGAGSDVSWLDILR